AVVVFRVRRLLLVQDEADDIMGTTLVECLLQGGIDHIVRRGHDVAQGADAAKVVAKCAKRANICHDGPSFQPDSEFAILLSGGAEKQASTRCRAWRARHQPDKSNCGRCGPTESRPSNGAVMRHGAARAESVGRVAA